MADTRRILRVNLNQDSKALVEQQRGSDTVSGFVASIVEGDAKEPGAWDGATEPVEGKDTVATISVSIPAGQVADLDRRRGDLGAAAYVSAILSEEAKFLKDGLAAARGAQVVQEAQHRQGGAAGTGQRRKGPQAEDRNGSRAPSSRPVPRQRDARSGEGSPEQRRPGQRAMPPRQHEQPFRGGHSRVEHRPRPPAEIRLQEAPWATWERKLPPHLQEVEDRLQAERAQKRAQQRAQAEQRAAAPVRPSKPASSTPASRVVEKLAPPSPPSRRTTDHFPVPQPHQHQESAMHSHLPPHPSHQPSLRPGVITRKNVAGDLRALDRLLDRWRSEELRWPPLDLIASLDHEGVSTTEAFAELSLRDLGHSARILVGLSPEDGEWIGLEEGELRATWQRALAVIQAHAERYLLRLEATPTVWSRALEQDDDGSAPEYDDEYDDEYDSEDLDEEAQDEPLVTSVLGIDISVVAVGRPSQPQWR